MVTEYAGEVIRQQIMEIRESAFDRSGIGSSCLFKMSRWMQDWVSIIGLVCVKLASWL
jgi:hypothetical protein